VELVVWLPPSEPELPPSEVVDVSPLPEVVVWVPPPSEVVDVPPLPELVVGVPPPSEVVDVPPLPELVVCVSPPSDREPPVEPELLPPAVVEVSSRPSELDAMPLVEEPS
jgi:hypothetical protein